MNGPTSRTTSNLTTSTTTTTTATTTTPTPTTTPTATSTPPTSTTEATINTGAVAGGVVGGVLIVVVVILVVIFFLKRRKAKRRKNARPPPMAPGREELDPRADTYTPITPETPIAPETPITPETPSENVIAPAYNQEDPLKQLKLYANVGDNNEPEEDTDPALDLEGYVKVRLKDPTIDAKMLVPGQDKARLGKTKKHNKRSKQPKPDKTTVDDADLQPYTNLGYGSEAGGNLHQLGDRDVRNKMPESNPEKSNGKFNKAIGLEDDYELSDVKTAENATEDYENSLKISIALDKNRSKTASEAGEDYENSAKLSTHVGKNRVNGVEALTEGYENSLFINSDIGKNRIKVDDSTEDYENSVDRDVRNKMPESNPEKSNGKFNKAIGLEDDYELSDVKKAENATEDYENSLKISIALDKNRSKTASEAGEDYEKSAKLSTHVGKNRVKGVEALTEGYENSLFINSDIGKNRIKVDDSTEDYENSVGIETLAAKIPSKQGNPADDRSGTNVGVSSGDTEDYENVQPTFPPPKPHVAKDKHHYHNLRSSE